MKVLHITTSSKGGAGIAALRLHEGLRKEGVASAYLSINKTITFQNREIEDPFFKYYRTSLLKRMLRKIKSVVAPSQSHKFDLQLAKIEAQLSYEILSLPFSSYALEGHPLVIEADIINLHWIGKLIDYPSFFKNLDKPMVWTLHDMNPFEGIFHYHIDKQKNTLAKKIDAQVFALKKKAVSTIKKGTIVSPSQWMLDWEQSSSMFQDFETHVCIPNSIGTSYLVCDKKVARNSLGITLEERVLLFSAASFSNPRKGMDILVEALNSLSISITLLTLGKGTVNTSNKNVKVIPLGFKTSQEEIALCYAAADVFVLPSREDNLPNTMLESLAQGTPVISFGNGGMQEAIIEGIYGMIVKEVTPKALQRSIELFFKERNNYSSEAIQKFAQEQFNYKKQAEAYTKVYQQLIS